MIIPAPMPISVLVTISSVSVRESMQPMPLSRNIDVPMTNIRILLRFTDQRPASSIKGMIINEGSDSSIDTSSSLALENNLSMSSSMGDTASPGSDTIADTDHIATSAVSVIVPFPVLITIILQFFVNTVQLPCRWSICFSRKKVVILLII